MAHGEEIHKVSVTLSNNRGKVRLDATNAGAVGKYDWVGLYRGRPPMDPNRDYIDWQWVTKLPYESNVDFNTSLVAAYVAWDYLDNRWEALALHDKASDYKVRVGLNPTARRTIRLTGGMDPQRGAVGAYDWVGIWASGEANDLGRYADWQWVRHLPYESGISWGEGWQGLYVGWDYKDQKYVELARLQDITRWSELP